ncbi:AAA family ATPase [Chromobacterium violaceum]|uniref:AAA family ATPase n=1 Tax=Chromobacterium violaceum TaxID=536 RepID=UPI00143CC8A6|nr:AAA family ATPase [Chromobacterium violaceum]QIY79430.1 AAA family ATPase [Chromobacterium violaceum]
MEARVRRCFIDVVVRPRGKVDGLPLVFGFNPAGQVERILKNIIHVPGVRGNPERSYRLTCSSNFSGQFDQHVASIIKEWVAENKKIGMGESKLKQLISSLESLGLASDICVKSLNDTRVEISIPRVKNSSAIDLSSKVGKDLVNISDVGFGVSQCLPVLVALLTANKGDIVYVEQPELHLHPNAQFLIAKMFVESVNRGVKVIVETHSSLFLRGIQIAVARKQIRSESVSMNWFEQDSENGDTNINSVNLDSYGRFGEWPIDFDDVGLRVEGEYLDAVEQAMDDDISELCDE